MLISDIKTPEEIIREMGEKIDRRMDLRVQALSAYFNAIDNPKHNTNRDELWKFVFGSQPQHITIPMYLYYIEGWSHRQFADETGLSEATSRRWCLEYRIPYKHKGLLIAVMDDIDPFDTLRFLEARDNESQWWNPRSKTAYYRFSKTLAKQANAHMERLGEVDYRRLRYKNPHRTKMMLTAYAETKGWYETRPGCFVKEED